MEEITDNNPSIEECKIAIKSVWNELSSEQKEILIYTHKNPGVTCQELAMHMERDNNLGFWGVYGRMARKIYDVLGKDLEDQGFVSNLLWKIEENSVGDSWKMFFRPQFAKALEELNLDEEDKFEVKSEKTVELNSLGLELSEKIQQTMESEFKDEKTMRCFYSKVKFKRNLFGLCWIDPLQNQSVVVYLRKADYSSVDPNKIVKYSVPGSETFGGYPLVKINNFSEVDYVLRLIKWVYEKDEPDSEDGGE